MWNKGVLGSGNPQKLLDTVLYNFGLNFALRAGQEHRNLRFGDLSQIKLKVSQDDGKRYLEYREDTSKTYSGGIHHRKVVPKMTRAYENGDQPDRCVVRLYEKYCSFRPKDGRSPALYLRPKKYPTDTQWYDDVPVGIHSLQGTVARLCKEAGFVGRYTNHSLRVTAATRLFVAGVDEQLIAEKTGHRSTEIRGYKRTSEAQQREVSDIVQKKVKAGNAIATATTVQLLELVKSILKRREFR